MGEATAYSIAPTVRHLNVAINRGPCVMMLEVSGLQRPKGRLRPLAFYLLSARSGWRSLLGPSESRGRGCGRAYPQRSTFSWHQSQHLGPRVRDAAAGCPIGFMRPSSQVLQGGKRLATLSTYYVATESRSCEPLQQHCNGARSFLR